MSLSAEAAENGAADEVSLNVEDVVHGGVDGDGSFSISCAPTHRSRPAAARRSRRHHAVEQQLRLHLRKLATAIAAGCTIVIVDRSQHDLF